MATLYWKGGGADTNWSTAANWTLTNGSSTPAAAPPGVADIAYFTGVGSTANSLCTISSPTRVSSLYLLTAFSGAISHSADLTITDTSLSPSTLHWNSNHTSEGTGSVLLDPQVSTFTISGSATNPCKFPLIFSGSGRPYAFSSVSASFARPVITRGPTNFSFSNYIDRGLIFQNGLELSSSIGATSTRTRFIISGGVLSTAGTATCLPSIDISGSVVLGTAFTVIGNTATDPNTFSYISGSLITSGSTLVCHTHTALNLPNIQLNNIGFSGSTGTLYLSQSLTLEGALLAAPSTTINIRPASSITSASITCCGILFASAGTLSGSANLIITTGSWTSLLSTAVGNLGLNIDISGSVSIGNVSFNTNPAVRRTLRVVSGSINCISGSTFRLSSGLPVIDAPGTIWQNVLTGTTTPAPTITLSSSMYIGETLNISNGASTTFTSALASSPAGWNARTLLDSNTGVAVRTLTLQAGVEYVVREIFSSSVSTRAAALTVISNNATDRAFLTSPPGSRYLVRANFTRIDASRGIPLRTWTGTVTDCVNIEQINDLLPAASSFISSF